MTNHELLQMGNKAGQRRLPQRDTTQTFVRLAEMGLAGRGRAESDAIAPPAGKQRSVWGRLRDGLRRQLCRSA